jgi:YaiO family outer membrane protein
MKPALRLALALALLAPPLALGADPQPLVNEAELGFSHYALSNGYANWDATYLDGAHRFGEHHSIYGELRETRRFNLVDREVSGGYYHPLGETWTALVEAGASPDHNVLPQHSLSGQLQKALGDGWDVQAGVRHTQYTSAATDLTVLTGERYWGNYRAAYTLYLGKLQGAGTAPSHTGQFSYYYDEHSYLTLLLSRGRQAESLGSGLGVLLLDVTSTAVTGRHWLSPAWGVSYESIAERQGNLYSRKGISLGLRYAF